MIVEEGKELTLERWRHQSNGLLLYPKEPRWLHRWDPRTGKTLFMLDCCDKWQGMGLRRFMIVASKTALVMTWKGEAAKYLSSAFDVHNIFEMDPKTRRETLFKLATEKSWRPWVVFINQELLPMVRQYLEMLHIEVLIMDEIHNFMNPSGVRHLIVKKIADQAKIVRGLSGTPVSSKYENVYGIYKILDDRIFGTKQSDFQARYVIYSPRDGHIIGYQNVKELKDKMLWISDEVYKKDCFDMPQLQDVFREVILPKHVRAMYNEVAKEHVLTLIDDKEVTFDHLFARLPWLQQLTGGYLPARQGVGGEWFHDTKLNACKSEVEDIIEGGEKVVIMHRFTNEGFKIAESLGYTNAAHIHADTPFEERLRIKDAFNEKTYPKALVIQQKIGSEAISLVGANYILFYSAEPNHLLHDQGVERIFKAGSDVKLTRIYLTCPGTVDTYNLQIIRRQRAIANSLRTLTQDDLKSIVYGEVSSLP